MPLIRDATEEEMRNVVAGTIDVESERLNAFSDRDELFLEIAPS